MGTLIKELVVPLGAAVLTAVAGIVGAVIGAVVGGAIGWIGAYHTAISTEERRERREREHREAESKRRDEAARTIISTEVERFLQRWGITLRRTDPANPFEGARLGALDDSIARFNTFPELLGDVRDEYWKGRYLQLHLDLPQLALDLLTVSLGMTPGDPGEPTINTLVRQRMHLQAQRRIKSILAIGEELRLAVDVFDPGGDAPLVTTPGVRRARPGTP